MSEEADALAEAAGNRGLKLVRSRVRTPTKRAFGKLGLLDSEGEPLFGMKDGKPAAKPGDIAEYLRAMSSEDWQKSLRKPAAPKRRMAKPRSAR